MDFGVLAHADRFWTSDATDAQERVRIQRRASLFFPCEMLGAHVGPNPNPLTGRRHAMAFRALVALFGHFGVELDPAHLDPLERLTLKNAIALYRQERAWMIDAQLRRCDCAPEGAVADLLIAPDGGEALLRVLRLAERARPQAAPVTAPFFEAEAGYDVTEILIEGVAGERAVATVSGRGLAEKGLDADPAHAGAGRLFRIRRSSA
jgi:alpha-galactosidase